MNEPTLPEESLFLKALELDSAQEQAAFLDRECGSNAELRSSVEGLLHHHREGSRFLESPPTEVIEVGEQLTADDTETPPLDFLEPATETASIGRLGHYEILEVLGAGGFGVVLKARDVKLDRIVAVKTLAQSLASSATARRRFVREAKAAAAVKHENVVGIYHVSDEGPVPYLVMECVSGQSLEQKLQQDGMLDLPAILRIGMQVAAGLAAAHKQGLVHRDVKPGNILLENGVERVKITDFGLARAANDAAITRTGDVAGTPQYMSPEQALGQSVDARSDLFSLGSVLYAMCTGRSPFRAETTIAALRRVCDDTPRPIREVHPEIPEWLVAIIDRLLAKKPEERYQTAAEVADLLGQHLAELQDPSLPTVHATVGLQSKTQNPKFKIRPRHWAIAAAAIVILLIGISLTEATGVTHFAPTVIRIVRGEGTLVIEVADPAVQVSLDGEELSIRGAGIQEFRLTPGKYRVHATKDGQPVKDEVVTISRDGREVVKVTLESSGRTGLSSIAGLPISEGIQLAMASEVAWSSERINALVEANPDDPSTLLKRCHWYAVRFRWRDARADLERVVAMQPDALELRADLAAICIFLEDSEAYATHCDVLLRRLPGEARPWKVYTAARSLLLSDSAKFDFSMVRNEVTRRMTPDENATQKRFVPISHYRCGDWQACVDEAEKLSPQGPKTMWDSLHWVYRAMALYRLGRIDEAKSSLAAIRRVTEGERGPYRTAKPGGFQNFFFDGIHVQVVYREASALILGQRQELNLAPIAFPREQTEVPAVERPVGELKLLAKLDGHTDVVRAVAFLPDGQRAVSVGRDKTVRVWDLKSRSVVSTFPVEGFPANADVSTDGRLLATVSNMPDNKGIAQVWDLETRSLLWNLPQEFRSVYTARFSRDGTKLVTTGKPPGGVLWDIASGKASHRFDLGDTISAPMAAVFSPNGRILALGAVGRVRLFDVETGDVLGDVPLPHDRHVNDLQFIATGKMLACGQLSGSFSVIDVDSKQVVRSFQASDAPVVRLRLLGNDRFILATCFDATLRILNIERGVVVATVTTEKGTNERLAISPNGQFAITASGEEWDAASKTNKRNGDYALRLWELPESVWPKKADRSLTPTADGFTPLFNGKDLTGWAAAGGGMGMWKIEDGALTSTGARDHLLTTRNDFGDFHLRAEVKINANGNSGIYFRTGKPLALIGDYEAQITDNPGQGYKTGSLFGLVRVSESPVPPDTWFTLEIIAVGRRIRIVVNGKETADYTDDRAGRNTKGHIALQHHDVESRVFFRKVEVKELSRRTSAGSGAFVLVGGAGVAERQFDTLADAVQDAGDGDIIEIRGNGPFVTGPIKLPPVPLAIRAGEGYRPVIEAGPDAWDSNWWISANGPLVVEGLEFRGGKIEPQTYGGVLVANTGSPLFVANCRFVFLLPRVNPIQANNSTNCEIRHCEFLFGPIANNTVVWNPRRDCRLTVDGCIVAGPGLKIFLGYGAPIEPCSVEFTRNTVSGPWAIWLERWSDIAAQGQPLSLGVADNVFDCPAFLNHSDKSGEAPRLAPAEAVAFVKQLVAYEEQRNIHSGGGKLLWCRGTTGSTAPSPDGTVNDLKAWQTFWGQQATSSRTGSVHFEGGAAVAYANLNLNSREVTPADFRLRADSAGYRTGPDGKDLGADVDLVGPGAAYERWKQTPEYQEWLKKTGQIAKAEASKTELQAFVLLTRQAVEVRKFDTLAEAVQRASAGDTIEIRGNGPFVSQPIKIQKTDLTIRAGAGFRPVINLDAQWHATDNLIRANSPLVLEGLEIKGGTSALSAVHAAVAIRAANCRFRSAISTQDSAICVLQNCEFSETGGGGGHSLHGARFRIENCLYWSKAAALAPNDPAELQNVLIEIKRTTFVNGGALAWLSLRSPLANPEGPAPAEAPLRFVAEECIFDVGNMFAFGQTQAQLKAAGPEAAAAEATLRQLVGWRGTRNLFAPGRTAFAWWVDTKSQPLGPKNLEEWKQFWQSPENDSQEGRPRFHGGGLLARADLDQLTPDDFRLRPDSPGYQAGPNGKDLGADVDLVGPGAAYERWKETTDYQEWFKETGQTLPVRAVASASDAMRELAKLKGEWENPETGRLVISGDRWSWHPNEGPEVVSTIKIVEVTDKLTHVLLLNNGADAKLRTIQAILKVDGDTLHNCGTVSAIRPMEFANRPGYLYVQWKRVTKPPP